MQIQDITRRPKAVDGRSESHVSFRSLAIPNLEVGLDAFAQVFEAISTTPAPKHDSFSADVTASSFLAAGEEEANALRQADEIGETSEVAESTPLPYPIHPAAIETEIDAENTESETAVKLAGPFVESGPESPVDVGTLSGGASLENAEETSSVLHAAGVQNESTIAQQASSVHDGASSSGKHATTAADQTPADKGLLEFDRSTKRKASTEANGYNAESEVSASNTNSEANDENSLRSNTDPERVASVENRKDVASTIDSSLDLSRDDRHQRDRSGTSFNEARQDAVNASKDRENTNSDSKVNSSLEAPSASTVDSGLAHPPALGASSSSVTVASTTAAATSAASAGIVAVSGQPTPSKFSPAGPPDVLSISTGPGPTEFVAEVPTSDSTVKSRQAEAADRARLVHRIAKAFQKMGIDGGHVRLKMHPDELGGVQLEMQVKGRNVTVTVTADNEQARQLIQASITDLRQRLEGQGLVIDRLDVRTQSETSNSGSWNQNPQQSGAGYHDETGPRDGAWRRQDEIRSGRSSSRTAEFQPERTSLPRLIAQKSGSFWLQDRGLDVKL